MPKEKGILAALLGVLVVLWAWPAAPPCLAAGPDQPDSARQARLKIMGAKGAGASLTIFPVVLWDVARAKGVGDASLEAAQVVGALLEKAGMDNLETGEAAFLLPAEAEFDRAAEPFGEFVRNHPIKTDYALYAEFLGRRSPPRFHEVRGVVVDKTGACLWVERQTPDDPDFKRLKPDCPMTCCVLLAERLGAQLGLSEPEAKDTHEGKFAKLWAGKSGLPDQKETAAMTPRQQALREAAPAAKLVVLPVRLSDKELSQEGATHLAKLLSEQKLCQAEVLATPLYLEVPPSRNEQKVLWALARAFRDQVRQDPPEADYALYADYMFSPRDGRVMAVHYVVCDRDGEWVMVDFQNDHWDDFQSIAPKTMEDCNRLVAKRIAGYLR